ncbi:MAG: ankyrin repeat domain-containing protein [Burkholderiaceae bacterium]|nr:ankyrin repeat domain-containing protein [Burkholderiaceae bacterium]
MSVGLLLLPGLLLGIGASAAPVLARDLRIDLLEAVRINDAARVRELVRAGVDANAREKRFGPAVVMAARQKSFEALVALLESPRIDLEARNREGETALMLAAFHGDLPTLQALIARGAQVNQTGWTALHYAATGGDVAVIDALLAAHAYVDATSGNGTTPMMLAARQQNWSAMERLLDEGADPTLRNQAGYDVERYLRRLGENQRAREMLARIRTFRERYYRFQDKPKDRGIVETR